MAAQAAQLEDCVLSAVRSGTQTPAPSLVDIQVIFYILLYKFFDQLHNSQFFYWIIFLFVT